MKLVRAIRDLIRRALGVTDLGSRLDVLADESRTLRDRLFQEKDRRIIRLDYPPSYDFRPRWGYSRPTHDKLREAFARQTADYVARMTRLVAMLPRLKEVPRGDVNTVATGETWLGGAVNPIDTALLYQMVAEAKPRTYLEIGSGLTTKFAARAKADFGLSTRIVSIDPNPRMDVDGVCNEIIREPFEVGDLSAFEKLEPGDIVFMDGSHCLFPNSDVTVFLLDVLPNLKPGVIVHFHDIHLPDDYSREMFQKYWSEQYALAAYLLGAGERIDYLMPAYYFTRHTSVFFDVIRPILDWWGPEHADGWQYGGSFWFTHRGGPPV